MPRHGQPGATAFVATRVRIVLALATLAIAAAVRAQAPAMPIHTAALVGDLQAVQQHIRAGTDVDAKDAYGSTPLIVAATFGRAAVAKALLDAGADPDITNPEGSTALHAAAFLGHEDVVRILLDAGADRYLRNDAGGHHVNFAWGHGGQLIVLVHDLNMVVVLTSDPCFPGPRQDQASWRSEIANLTLVSEFVRSLPVE